MSKGEKEREQKRDGGSLSHAVHSLSLLLSAYLRVRERVCLGVHSLRHYN